MSAGKLVGEATDRLRAIFARRPTAARFTKSAVARLSGGDWKTEVQMGAHRLIVDQPPGLGGEDAGPNPGDLMRGALAACLAQNVAMHAARFDVALREVRVEVETEIDFRGVVGLTPDAPPGFDAIRYTVTIATDAPAERVRALYAFVEAHSPSVDDLRRALPVQGTLVVESPIASPRP